MKNVFFYFILLFPTRIYFWVSKMQILKKVKNHSTLLPADNTSVLVIHINVVIIPDPDIGSG